MKLFQPFFWVKLCLLIIPAFFSSCGLPQSDPTVYEEIDLVRFEVDSDHITAEETWVIVYLGQKQLAIGSMQAGGTTTLRSDLVPANAILTVVIIGVTDGPPKKYTVDTFTDIPAGYTFYFTGPPASFAQPVRGGQFTGKVTGVPGAVEEVILTDEYTASAHAHVTGTTIDFDGVPAEGGSEYNLVVRVEDGSLRHKVFTVTNGANLTIPWSDLLPYDQEVTFTFPESTRIYLDILGTGLQHDFDKVFQLAMHQRYADPHTSIVAGYIDWMHSYRTLMAVEYPNHTFVYQKLGTPSTGVAWPNPDAYQVSDNRLKDFDASVTGPFAYRITTAKSYREGYTVFWTVFSRNLAFRHPKLPAEILAEHPQLELDEQDLTHTLFVTGLDTYLSGVYRYIAVDPTFELIGVVK